MQEKSDIKKRPAHIEARLLSSAAVSQTSTSQQQQQLSASCDVRKGDDETLVIPVGKSKKAQGIDEHIIKTCQRK